MKTSTEIKLLSIIEMFISKFSEEDFDIEKKAWNENNNKRIIAIDKSWRNICKTYKKDFDNLEDYKTDLEAFLIGLKTLETQFILKHLYEAEIKREIIYHLIHVKQLSPEDTAIYIINNLNYKVL